MNRIPLSSHNSILIRPECDTDFAAINRVITTGFGSSAEAQLVAALRNYPTLQSLVAVMDDAVVGHIAFSPVTFADASPEISAYGLAPLAVSPEYQNQGIGTALVRAGLELLEQAGANIIVVLGDPAYYSRFGFQAASMFNITCKWSDCQAAFQVWSPLPAASIPQGLANYAPEFDSL